MTVRITSMGGGAGAAEYLWKAQACAEEHQHDEAQRAATRGDVAEYYQAAAERGEAPGRLAGGQLGRVGLEVGQVPDKDTALRLLRCKDPTTGEQLGRKLRVPPPRDERLRDALRAAGEVSEEQAAVIARMVDKASHPGTAFYDVTCAASKSVSVYYALLRETGQHELADKVLSAHDDAVHYAMAYFEEHTWTRTGPHGRAAGASTGRHEHVGEHMRLHFQHSTSRAKDPHLHTHVAVINKVMCGDGKWRTINGRAWMPHKATAAARYEAKLAELIEERTPARLVVREDGMAREVIGLDPTILEASSQRTQQVMEARDRALTEFRFREGREPTPAEMRRIHRTAGLESRDRKDGSGPAQQYQDWARRMNVDLAEAVAQVHQAGQAADFWRVPASEADLEASAVWEALAEVQARSATWDVGVLTAAVANKLPPKLVERAGELAAEATAPGNRFGVVDLTRRDLPNAPQEVLDHRQRPVWRDPALDGAKYALADHLRAETQLVASARTHTVTPWTNEEVAALRAQWRQAEDTISEEQADAVCAVLQSPQAGDVLVAAAGTGKTYMSARLADAWRSRGGEVIGTTTSQKATMVLAEETGGETLNTTKFLQAYGPDHPGAGRKLPAGSLLLVDEANMTSTDQLRRLQQIAERDGAKVLYFGDPAQLDAVGAGGGLGLLASDVGTVAELTEARRFQDEWEGEASILLREGDLAALDEYEQRGRIHGGTRDAMVSHAVDRYVAAVVQGRSAALITGTNTEAAEVSGLVQQRLATLGRLSGEVAGTGMDRNLITVGDRIQWRENVHTVDADNGQALANREFLRVEAVEDGRVRLVRESDNTAVRVPAEWLGSRAALGYAGTEHAYEGVTVDVGHALTPGYVAMTRGRVTNEAWLATQEAADEHGEAVRTTPRELFEQRLSPEGQEKAALQAWREEIDAERHTAALAAAWETTSQGALRDATIDSVGAVVGRDVAYRMSEEGGFRALTAALARAEFSGHDRDAVLRDAVDSRPLDRVDDVAAVLAWRVDRAMGQRTPERDASTWRDRAAGLAGRGELGEFLVDVGRRMDDRIQELGARAVSERPQWALPQLGEPPVDETQRDEWVTRAGRIAAYRERAGISDALPSVGARPHNDDVTQQAAWRDAALAAGRPVDESEYHAMPDSDLAAARARWRRLADAAPTYVEPELGRAYDQQRQADADVALLRAAAETAGSERDREELLRRAEGRARDVEIAAERTRMLSELHAVRQAWVTEHEREQDAAVEAERELKRRGNVLEGPQQEPEQTQLFQVTTEEAPPRPEWEPDPERDMQREEQLALDLEVEPEPVDETGLDVAPEPPAEPEPDVVTEPDVEPDREPDPSWSPGPRPLETEWEPDPEPEPEPVREEPEEAPEPVVDEHQTELVEVEPAPVDVARQQTVASELDEDQAEDQVHTEALQVWEMVGRAEDMKRTLAEAETRARYAEEQMQQRAAERDAEAADAEHERQQRDARDEVEADPTPKVEQEPEREPSGPSLELHLP